MGKKENIMYKQVALLDKVFRHCEFGAMLKSGQAIVSPNGEYIAILKEKDKWGWNLEVNGEREASPVWYKMGNRRFSPRLLGILPDGILIAGALADGREGIFFSKQDEPLIHYSSCEEIIGVQQSASGPLVFAKSFSDPEDERRFILPSLGTDVRIHRQAFVTGISSGRALVLDTIGGNLYRFLIGPDGFSDVAAIPIAQDDLPIGIVCAQGIYLLAIPGSSSSTLFALGKQSWDLNERSFDIEGTIEYIWQSPTHKTYAFLTRIQKNKKTIRALCLGTNVIHTGQFTMGPNDLVWSPDGNCVGAKIRTVLLTGETVTFLVGLKEEFRCSSSDLYIDEFSVDNIGNLRSWIMRDGPYHRAYIGEREHQSVEFAWNMRLFPDGSVGYNCLYGAKVMNVIDRTDVGSNIMS